MSAQEPLPAMSKNEGNHASGEEIITRHMGVWTGAVTKKSSSGRGNNKKVELTGIKKLRELILQLAVTGRLVEQNVRDEPVSTLLKRIAATKTQLIKAGTLRKQKPSPPLDQAKVPFAAPGTWEWVTFGEITFNLDAERIPLSVDDRRKRNGDFDYYGASGVIDSIDDYLFDSPMLLIGEDGANLINRATPIAFIARGKYWVNNHAHVIDGISEDFLRYLCLYINAISLEPYITGTAQPKMNQAKMNSIPVPLPPIEEQHRIVQKVDELMALCDRLEQQASNQLDAHETLVDTLLGTLTQSESATELADNWARLAKHFDTLCTTEQSIDKLKQTILQLAVMGRLVEQDAGDEPAERLLNKIDQEITSLVKQGHIKNPKVIRTVEESDKLYEVPDSWQWVRLGSLALHSEGGWSPKCHDNPRDASNWGVLKVSAVTWGKFRPEENKELPTNLAPRPDYEVKASDFLISRANTSELVARSVVVPEDAPSKLMMSDKIIRFVFSKEVEPLYLNLFNNSPFARNYYLKVAGGTSSSMKNVARAQIQALAVPLPPKAEQKRIVQKVNGILALCDQLKERLKQASDTRCRLAGAVVEGSIR